ncbi:MAG: HAMP domain-containing histidine kinase [Lachnospiraceae bacterium]|nr:HAMP domain-containing histidine kinase [Lachnospiraceae bacterium]
MDTKWKKCRAAAGFLTFFLAVTLFACGFQGILLSVLGRNDPYCSLTEVLGGDYENTRNFRKHVSECLNDLIRMAVGESQQWPVSMEQDENLLYEVCYEGRVLYTNKKDLSKYVIKGIQLEGYNFLLWFNGSTVRIFKDGDEIEVYGDEYYGKDSQWDVPGYKNRIAGAYEQKVSVYMAVRQIPQQYYDVVELNGYKRTVSEWYLLSQRIAQSVKVLYADVVCICISAILLLGYLLLKKDKRRVDEAAAVLLGRIWVEAKMLALILLAALLLAVQNGIPWRAPQSRVILPTLIWVIYFIVLDCKRNKDMWRRGLCVRALRLYRTELRQMPISRQMICRCIPPAFISLLLCVAFWGLVLRLGQPYLLVFALLITGTLGVVFFMYMYWQQQLARELDLLAQRMAAVRGGDYSGVCAVASDSILAEMARDLEDIRQGTETALEQQIQSQRMKVELVANVSHDIKTPLTSIISYVQLLKAEEGLEEHVKDYVRILDEKSQRLRNMVQDVFEISKAASGQLTVNMETLDFSKLLRQTLADMDEQIQGSRVTVKAEIPQQEVLIQGDGEKLYRVFQNLIQNALKYSLEGSRVYVTLSTDDSMAAASVKNTSRDEIDSGKDFTERFVRGDASRTDGGSGLGLSIARSFTEACGGSFELETIADLFMVTVSFGIV